MAARIFAGSIFIAGAVLIAAVFLGGGASEEAVETVSPAPAGDSVGDAPVDADGAATPTTEAALPVPENLGHRIGLQNLEGWLNTDISSLDELDGKVVVLELWTFGCFNCQNRIPHTQALYAQLEGENFDIIGVHAPEFDFERDIPSIERAMVDLGVTWPVAIDSNKENFRAWQEGGRRFWPRTYVVDQNGDIRFDHIGEGDYEELGDTVRYLLANPPESTTSS